MSILANKTFLIVDDEQDIRELFVNELASYNCLCVEAENGLSAIEQYQRNKFDAVISDIRMPGGDGMFFLQRIFELGEPSSLLVFITGFSETPIEDFYELGADLVVQKPFEVDLVVKMIENSFLVPRSQWRQMVRLITILDVEVRFADSPQQELIPMKTYNMSRRGFFIQSLRDFPDVNSVISISVHLKSPYPTQTFFGQAKVRWVRRNPTEDRPSGFGIEWLEPYSESMNELAQLVGLNYLNSGH